MIELSRSAGDAVGLYALVVVTGLLGLTVNLVFRFVERRALSWHQSVRGEEAG
jgi:ABC-type nitrate/sulfonate/bicarbonate transport system permease component